MTNRGLAMVLLGLLALAGCKSDDDDLYTAPKPLDKMSNEEWCAFYAKFVANPNLDAKTKAADQQRMRERGCPATG